MPRRLPGAILLAALAAAASASPYAPAFAQVTVNPGALDLLPSPKPQSPEPRRQSPARPTPHRTPHTTTPAPHNALTTPEAPAPQAPPTATQAQPAPKPPPVPTVPPAVAALPPPPPIPPPRAQPAPTIPLSANAPGAASPIPDGVRITFGPDSQDLNPTTEAALRTLATSLLRDPSSTVNLYAYAAGAPEDPSTPRRLSLGRALAARAVLIQAGIASTRIYPRALGPAPTPTTSDPASPDPTLPPDRVDAVAGPPGPPRANVNADAAPR